MRALVWTSSFLLTALCFAGIVAAAPDAGVRAPVLERHEAGTVSRIPPDPPAMFERGQWIFDLRYDSGDIYLLGVHRIDLPAPQATPRVMGRFALELFEGPTLVERVRFDFPMLIAGDLEGAARRGQAEDAGRRRGLQEAPPFDKKLSTRIGVMFPVTSHGNRMELWDRATDRRYPLPWPPDARKDGG